MLSDKSLCVSCEVETEVLNIVYINCILRGFKNAIVITMTGVNLYEQGQNYYQNCEV
jgi:hypothetical protein